MRSPKWNMPVDATLPASVKSWLGQQLELRGIDAVIYTRYILSILQQDSRDLEVAEPELFPAPAAAAERGGSRDASASRISKPKVKAMKRMEKRGSREVDLEELKKTAAVECLMSVSDEDCGIENLVEELCLRLKEQKLFNREVAAVEVEDRRPCAEHSDGNDSVLSSSPEDPAERYYAAFPPLRDDPKGVKPKTTYTGGCVWAKLAQKSHGSGLNSDDGGDLSDTAPQDPSDPKDIAIADEKAAVKTGKGRSGTSVKAKISRLEVKLSKPEKGKKKYTPHGSPNEHHIAKKSDDVQVQQQSTSRPWQEDLETGDHPTFLVPKLEPTTNKQVQIPLYIDGKPFEKPDLEEGPMWLLQILEENKRAIAEETKELPRAESPNADYEVQGLSEGEGQDDSAHDFNLSILYGQEDLSWYTKPIHDFLAPSPVPTQRLYKRRSDADLKALQESDDESSDVEGGSERTKLTVDQLQAVLTQLLSPKEPELEEKLQSPGLSDGLESNSLFFDCGQEIVGLCQPECECGNNNNKGESTCLPTCHCASYGTRKSGVSSPVELASQAIPFSTENEVLDDRPGTLELPQQLQETLCFLQDSEPDDADGEQGFNCAPDLSIPIVNNQFNLFSSCTNGLTTEPTAADHSTDTSTGVLGVEWSLPTSLHSELTYDVCDNLCTTSNSSIWLSGIPGAWSLGLETTDTMITMQTENMWSNDQAVDQTVATNMAGYFHPQKDHEETFQIWDINASKRQLDLDVSYPHSRERTNTTEKLQRSLLHIEYPPATDKEFIEGGLYGSDWASADPSISTVSVETSTFEASPLCGIEEEETMDSCWESFSLKPPHFRQRSTSADEVRLSEEHNTQGTVNNHNTSLEITPSENTAFQDRIPPHMSHLLHVQSEPILSPSKMAQRRDLQCEASHRLVQIKHLYKSDTSILKELGLANGSDYEEVDQKTELEISPDRHFKPIISPPGSLQNDVSILAEPGQSLDTSEKSKVDSDTSFGSDMRSAVSGYQLYCSENKLGNEASTFVPRFKIVVECDKSAQTGEDTADTPEEDEFELTERLLEDMNNMLKMETDDDDECPSFTVRDIVESSLDQSPIRSLGRNESIAFPAQFQDKLGEGTDVLQGKGEDLVNLWTEEDDLKADPKPEHCKNIWSCGTDMDIPNLPDSWSLKNTYGAQWSEGQEVPAAQGPSPSGFKELPHCVDDEEGEEEPEWMNADPDDVFFEESLDMDTALFPFETQSAVPHGSVLYSSDLEEQWLSSEPQFEVQVPKRKPRPKKGAARKPCSFFMEGSCRRTDCKFAHDMSNITCRFWEEGECFKGITCPFLHGYPEESLESVADFSLEPEDFPLLLGTSNDKDQVLRFGAEEKETSATRKLNSLNSSDKSRVAYSSTKRVGQLKLKAKSLPIDIKPNK